MSRAAMEMTVAPRRSPEAPDPAFLTGSLVLGSLAVGVFPLAAAVAFNFTGFAAASSAFFLSAAALASLAS